MHLTYQTAFVDEDGKLQFRDDVYGRDAKMIRIIKGSERKVADIPIERPRDTSPRRCECRSALTAAMATTITATAYSYGGGPHFFDFLFGGGQRSAAHGRAANRRPRRQERQLLSTLTTRIIT